MKWKYKNADEMKPELNPVPFTINIAGNDDEYAPMMGSSSVKVINNKIYFYGDVDVPQTLELNRCLREMDTKLQNTKNMFGDNFIPTIDLHVSTFGGGIFEAFATVDTIRNLKSDVNTYIDGNVASAGTLVTSIGKRRFIGEHGHLLIHQLSSGVYGKFAEIEDEVYNCTNLMKLLKEFYKKHTKIPMKKLDELLKRDIWLNAQQCLEYGFVDEIY
jgi:ATP-dependent protease ClpP protease subunit